MLINASFPAVTYVEGDGRKKAAGVAAKDIIRICAPEGSGNSTISIRCGISLINPMFATTELALGLAVTNSREEEKKSVSVRRARETAETDGSIGISCWKRSPQVPDRGVTIRTELYSH